MALRSPNRLVMLARMRRTPRSRRPAPRNRGGFASWVRQSRGQDAFAREARLHRLTTPRRLRSSVSSALLVRRGARGGFFKSLVKGIGKAVSTVGKIPVLGTVAKTALGSVPVIGAAMTAVNTFKAATRPPTVTTMAPTIASVAAGFPSSSFRTAPARRRSSKRKRTRGRATSTRKRRSTTRRRRGVSEKQRRARARFARAAKRGRIKKGSRLR